MKLLFKADERTSTDIISMIHRSPNLINIVEPIRPNIVLFQVKDISFILTKTGTKTYNLDQVKAKSENLEDSIVIRIFPYEGHVYQFDEITRDMAGMSPKLYEIYTRIFLGINYSIREEIGQAFSAE